MMKYCWTPDKPMASLSHCILDLLPWMAILLNLFKSKLLLLKSCDIMQDVCASATAQWGGLGGDVCLDSDSPKSHVLVYGSPQDITVRFTSTNSRFPRGSTFTLIASGKIFLLGGGGSKIVCVTRD